MKKKLNVDENVKNRENMWRVKKKENTRRDLREFLRLEVI